MVIRTQDRSAKEGIPKVNIKTSHFSDGVYSNGENSWKVCSLIEKSKHLPVFDIPLVAINLGFNLWEIEDIFDFIFHTKKVKEASLNHPIILSESGFIMDGWHRVVKAILLERRTIKAVRFVENPKPDYTERIK